MLAEDRGSGDDEVVAASCHRHPTRDQSDPRHRTGRMLDRRYLQDPPQVHQSSHHLRRSNHHRPYHPVSLLQDHHPEGHPLLQQPG